MEILILECTLHSYLVHPVHTSYIFILNKSNQKEAMRSEEPNNAMCISCPYWSSALLNITHHEYSTDSGTPGV